MKKPSALAVLLTASALVGLIAASVLIPPDLARTDAKKCDDAPKTLTPLDLLAEPRTAPPGAFFDAAGKPLSLADFKGRGLVVNFWATWCIPCVKEMPMLAALARDGASHGLSVLALASDQGGAAKVEAFYRAQKINGLAIFLDPKVTLGRAAGVKGLPTTLLINAAGMEVGRVVGIAEWDAASSLAYLTRCLGP